MISYTEGLPDHGSSGMPSSRYVVGFPGSSFGGSISSSSEAGHRIGLDHPRSLGQRQGVEIAPQHREALCGSVDEDRVRGPAGKRLDPQRARPGVQVEDVCAVEWAEHGEQRLAHAVRGRSHTCSWGEQSTTSQLSRDHAHAVPTRFPSG